MLLKAINIVAIEIGTTMPSDDRTVEIKFVIPSPQRLFEMLKDRVKGSKLPSWETTVPWTKLMLDAFSTKGSELGYLPEREYLGLDETWPIRAGPTSYVAVAIEHESGARNPPIFTPMSEHSIKLGNKLGNIEQKYMPNKHNISSSGQIEVEISPKLSFDKSFQFTEGEY